MGRAGHVTRLEGKGHLGRLRLRWEENIKWILNTSFKEKKIILKNALFSTQYFSRHHKI
jgi:hypothetical protein